MHVPYVTRFAPSPTGKLHLGGARTAEFNWLAARASGGEFILRIDDTDAQRSKEEYVDEIKRGLEWLGLNWDEEYRQSERFDFYRCDIDWLVKNGLAVKDKDDSVRLDLPEETRPVCWHDTLIGDVPISDKDWEYARTAVIARSGYMPLYNFTSICDDMTLGINYVIRGTDHITNTALQSVIKHVLWKTNFIQFTHVGLIHSDTGKKMSKREGDDSFLLSHYIDKGYLSESMFDCLLRLGWGPKNEDKTVAVLTRERALELFLDGGNLRSSPAKFDLAKLDSFNRKHRGILAKS